MPLGAEGATHQAPLGARAPKAPTIGRRQAPVSECALSKSEPAQKNARLGMSTYLW